ncbi:MAG: hypothetical protein NVSMB52_02490 [Chloroflexota bacterium]
MAEMHFSVVETVAQRERRFFSLRLSGDASRTVLLSIICALMLSACGSSSSTDTPTPGPAAFGQFCIDGPERVAVAPDDSVYILDNTQLLHVAQDGKLLWKRAADPNGGLAVDTTGNAYDISAGSIQKLSTSGNVAAQWPAQNTSVEMVDSGGIVYAVDSTQTDSSLVVRFSPSGTVLGQWRGPIGSSLTPGANGTLYAIGFVTGLPDAIVQLDPATGTEQQRWQLCPNCKSYDALTTDSHGTLTVGLTTGRNPPFSIATIGGTSTKPTFTTVNTADELVSKLSIDSQGNIYVIRNSFSRPGPRNTGLDKLSPKGALTATVRPCHPNA